MGAELARLKKVKINWCRCGCAKRRKGSVHDDDEDENYLPEVQEARKSSSEILQELRSAGIVPKATRGGMAFKLEQSHDDTPVGPRRLPSLSNRNRVHPANTSGITYDSQERGIMAEVRRQELLEERGRMGREHTERRQAVLQRRDEKLREKIRKTEKKLAGK